MSQSFEINEKLALIEFIEKRIRECNDRTHIFATSSAENYWCGQLAAYKEILSKLKE